MEHYTRMTLAERCKLSTFLQMGLSVTQMSDRMGRPRCTIYRELKRNSCPDGHYLPRYAQIQMKGRRPHKPHKIENDEELKEYVINGLHLVWSPEQIAGRLRHNWHEKSVCLETIYRYIYRQRYLKLYKLLPNKKPKRIKKHARTKRQNSLYMQARNIKNRDSRALTREVCGHWEGDTVRFERSQKACVTTLVERKSRVILIKKNREGKSGTVMENIKQLMGALPKKIRKSIAFDLGVEFTDFRVLEKDICPVYYCDARKPWQRPSNENSNGRLRRFLPRDCNIDAIDDSRLEIIQELMNNTPRKCLNFLTPYEALRQDAKRPCRTKT
jgi:IS30 family transposase